MIRVISTTPHPAATEHQPPNDDVTKEVGMCLHIAFELSFLLVVLL